MADFDPLQTPLPQAPLRQLTPMEQVRDQLPMTESIQERFIEAARSQYCASSGVDDLKLYNALLDFAHRLPRSQDLQDTRSLKEAIQEFIWDLTKPLRQAERRVLAAENYIYDQLRSHPAMVMEESDFRVDPDTTIKMLQEYDALSRGLIREIEAARRLVKATQTLFNDPDGMIIGMRNRLHDLENLLMGQAGRAQGVLRYKECDIPRMRWLEGLKTGLDDMVDLMPYLAKTHPESQVRIIPTEHPIVLSKPFVMRNIARHWIRNSLDKGASNVEVQLEPHDVKHYLFSVTDDVPGGFPKYIRPRLGKEQIVHHEGYEGGSGFEIICKHLAPQLGISTRIVIETPITARGGSRVSIIFPRTLPPQKPVPAGNGVTDHTIRPVPISFVEMDTPDWTQRAKTDPVIDRFYSQVIASRFFESARSGGLSLYRHGTTATPIGFTFSIKPHIP